MFDGIRETIHRELDQLDEKFANGSKISGQELENIDKMLHAMKCLATYEEMLGNSEDSYARGRSRTTGRYVSRDNYPENSYRRY